MSATGELAAGRRHWLWTTANSMVRRDRGGDGDGRNANEWLSLRPVRRLIRLENKATLTAQQAVG